MSDGEDECMPMKLLIFLLYIWWHLVTLVELGVYLSGAICERLGVQLDKGSFVFSSYC